MTPLEFMDYCTDEQEAEAIRLCNQFEEYANRPPHTWDVFPEWGVRRDVAYGPGHLVIDDYNWHTVPWCIDEAAKAIRNRLDGNTEDYDFLSLTQLALTWDFLRWLEWWMAQFPMPAAE